MISDVLPETHGTDALTIVYTSITIVGFLCIKSSFSCSSFPCP